MSAAIQATELLREASLAVSIYLDGKTATVNGTAAAIGFLRVTTERAFWLLQAAGCVRLVGAQGCSKIYARTDEPLPWELWPREAMIKAMDRLVREMAELQSRPRTWDDWDDAAAELLGDHGDAAVADDPHLRRKIAGVLRAAFDAGSAERMSDATIRAVIEAWERTGNTTDLDGSITGPVCDRVRQELAVPA